jgi:hypothetical protein
MGWIKSIFSSKKASEDLGDAKSRLIQAITDKHQVTLDYQGNKDPEPVTRLIIPTGMDGALIRAFDVNKKSYRSFHAPRIIKIHSTEPRSFEPPEDLEKGSSTGPGTYIPTEFAPEGTYPEPKPFSGSPIPEPPKLTPTIQPKSMPWTLRDNKLDWLAKESDSRPWESNDNTRMPREYAINPTPEEYKEARSKDIHPESFDKATYKRLRNMPGVTHADIINAMQTGPYGIPIEDYETARINNPGSHIKSIDEALKYQDFYSDLVGKNKITRNKAEGKKYKDVSLLSPEEHHDLVKKLVFHHGSLKNAPSFSEPNPDTPWRRRANRWVMSEAAKLEPSLKKYAKVDDLYDENTIIKPVAYDKIVTELLKHHTINQLNSGTVKDHMISNRMLNALYNIGSSKFLPTLYAHNKYEE